MTEPVPSPTSTPAAAPDAAEVALCLASHTNVGKTTVARTLLGRDVGEVRDAAHVTQAAEPHHLLDTPAGDRLTLWDTPGFGDSVRLARRLQHAGRPLGWFLTEVWDRFRDRPFWMAQKALRAVVDHADVVLYLVDASDPDGGADALRAELRVLSLLGKPVLVLLNQLGQPQPPDAEAAEIQAWRERTVRPEFPVVRDVLALDAFARCWVQEGVLLRAVAAVLDDGRQAAFARLQAAWRERHEQVFRASMSVLAGRLADAALDEVAVAVDTRWGDRLKTVARSLRPGGDETPADPARAAAMLELARRQQQRVRDDTDRLIRLHGLDGRAGDVVLQRMSASYAVQAPVDEGRAAVVGGVLTSVVTGAIAGLKVDVASGGLTLGGGLLAGALAGALGGAGVARGLNLLRGRDQPRVAWSDEALALALQEALLGYLAVAHYGRGRGQWREAEHPPFWADAVRDATERHRMAWLAWLAQRAPADPPPAPMTGRIGAALDSAFGGLRDEPAAPAPAAAASPTPAERRARLLADGEVLVGRIATDLLAKLYPAAAGPAPTR